MTSIATASAAVAALIHVGYFLLESVWFTRPKVYRRFFVDSPAEARTLRLMAFNQGFYNLFLACGAAAGAVAVAANAELVGRTLIVFSCACMAAAGIVLFLSDRRFLRAGAIQTLPALVAVTAAAAA
ncbi:MAG: DUF1304 domain-containing protein [Stackebrandtia sp.]